MGMGIGETKPAAFSHRQLSDASWESICLRCFRTVAVATTEDVLREAEAQHTCSIADLRWLSPMPK
jgi:hypothetical protein